MAGSPLRPTTAAGSVPYWRVPKVLFLAAVRSSSLLGYDLIDRFKAERFQLVLGGHLAWYSGLGILLPLWEYTWVARAPWLLAIVAVCAAQSVVLGAALRLARHRRYQQSTTLFCIGTWAGVLLLTFITPALLPVWVLGALVPVVFAEPYIRWQRGLAFAVITAGCALALGALASLSECFTPGRANTSLDRDCIHRGSTAVPYPSDPGDCVEQRRGAGSIGEHARRARRPTRGVT